MTIDQLAEATSVIDGDKLLISRGGVYYKITPQNLTGGIIKVTRTLTTAEVLASNGTPIVLLAAQGAQTFIEPLSVDLFLQYNSVAYITATHFRVHHSGQVNYRMKTSTSFIQSAANRTEGMIADDSAAANFVLYSNTAMVISANAVPADGDSPVLISALFRVTTF